MASIETEYGRFLEYLRDQNISEDAHRLAILVGRNTMSAHMATSLRTLSVNASRLLATMV